MKISLMILPITLMTAFNSAQALDPQKEILGMPLTVEQATFVTEQNQRTKDLLATVDSVLAKQISDRAAELAPKNAPTRLNLFGSDFGLKDGNIVRFNADGSAEIILLATVLPANAKFTSYRFSPDQTKLAYGYSMFGSDWQIWQIYDLTTKTIIASSGEFVFKGFGWPGLTWTPDSAQVVYASDTSIDLDFTGVRDPKVLIHKVGSSRSKDRILFEKFETPATSRWSGVPLTNDLVVVYRVQGVAVIPTAAFIVNIHTGERRPIQSVNKYLGNTPGTSIVGVHSGKIYLRSAQAGDKFGIMVFDSKEASSKSMAKVLVPAQSNDVLYQALILGNKILVQYIGKDLKISFKMFDLTGKLVAVMKPSDFGLSDLGHPSLPLTDGDATSSAGYFTFSNVTTAPVTFKADVVNGKFIKLEALAPISFDGSKIIERKVEYKSHDGEKITMLVYQRADQVGSKAKFAYLYSYGFIGIPNLSQWNRKFQLALEMGGIVALPMLRGGGEYGAEFQLSGTHHRLNTFKDLVFASRWLKKNMDLEQDRVVAVGRSFGGLSGSVHFVHHQSEFSLISAIVPVADWNQHFQMSGWWMGDDFGIDRDLVSGLPSPGALEKLLADVAVWDPTMNLKKLEGRRLIPAIFFTNQYDTNTTPHQSIQFVKTVQASHAGEPVYFMQHPNGGHGARAELVDEMLFIAKQFGLSQLVPLK